MAPFKVLQSPPQNQGTLCPYYSVLPKEPKTKRAQHVWPNIREAGVQGDEAVLYRAAVVAGTSGLPSTTMTIALVAGVIKL